MAERLATEHPVTGEDGGRKFHRSNEPDRLATVEGSPIPPITGEEVVAHDV
jgi:hypothetical protein